MELCLGTDEELTKMRIKEKAGTGDIGKNLLLAT